MCFRNLPCLTQEYSEEEIRGPGGIPSDDSLQTTMSPVTKNLRFSPIFSCLLTPLTQPPDEQSEAMAEKAEMKSQENTTPILPSHYIYSAVICIKFTKFYAKINTTLHRDNFSFVFLWLLKQTQFGNKNRKLPCGRIRFMYSSQYLFNNPQ